MSNTDESSGSIGFDDDPTPATDKGSDAKPIDADGVPYCTVHHCRMDLRSGGSKNNRKAYYKCPVSGCNETGIRIKTKREAIVPRTPQECPTCRGRRGKKSVCVRNERINSAFYVQLICPECGWQTGPLPKPQLAASHFRD